MPDGDLYRRAPAHAWKTLFRQISGGASPRAAARPARPAPRHTLWVGKGFPGLASFGGILARAKAGALNPVQAMEEVRALVRAQVGSQHAKVLGEATNRILADMLVGEPAPLDPALAVADRASSDLLDHHLFHLIEVDLVGKGQQFATRTDALRW